MFPNTYKFYNGDINNCVLLLKKDVYPYEYMDSWERFNEIIVPNKNAFYSKINLQDITDEDYIYAQKVFKEFEKKTQGNIMIYMFKVIHYCLQMHLKTLEINLLKYMNLILLVFICTGISMVNL